MTHHVIDLDHQPFDRDALAVLDPLVVITEPLGPVHAASGPVAHQIEVGIVMDVRAVDVPEGAKERKKEKERKIEETKKQRMNERKKRKKKERMNDRVAGGEERKIIESFGRFTHVREN